MAIRKVLSAFVIMAISCSMALAQSITGAISGTISDPAGAVVSNASVKATNTDTHFTRTGASDGSGAFSLQYLPIGKYDVEITADGFRKFV